MQLILVVGKIDMINQNRCYRVQTDLTRLKINHSRMRELLVGLRVRLRLGHFQVDFNDCNETDCAW